MDKIDLKILRKLDEDGRISLTKMARELRLSVQVVEYRLERMEKEGVLLGSRAVIDIERLGFRYYKLLLKFAPLSKEQEQELKKWIKQRDEVIWLGLCEGEWGAMITVKVKSVEEWVDFEHDLFATFGDLILGKEWLQVKVSRRFNRKYLYTPGKFVYELAHDFFTPAEYVDEKDEKMLWMLARDGRVTLREMAEKIGLSAEAVGSRLRILISRKMILAFRPKIDYTLFGLQNYEIFLAVKHPDVLGKVVEYYRQYPRADTIMELVGRYDLQVTLLLSGGAEFREVLADFRDRFGAMLMEYHALTMYKEL